ncbi:MAG: hypothetical protein GY750_17495 [Lentisphaerae bacterium]|nr:hypothetical protein [Lentisphaerota bacterium]MCP4103193.1 hypothetical protein [Lentisphaerota bacterium]
MKRVKSLAEIGGYAAENDLNLGMFNINVGNNAVYSEALKLLGTLYVYINVGQMEGSWMTSSWRSGTQDKMPKGVERINNRLRILNGEFSLNANHLLLCLHDVCEIASDRKHSKLSWLARQTITQRGDWNRAMYNELSTLYRELGSRGWNSTYINSATIEKATKNIRVAFMKTNGIYNARATPLRGIIALVESALED